MAAKEFIESVFKNYQLDAVVVPSECRVDSILKEDLKDFPIFGCTLACMMGYPSITVSDMLLNFIANQCFKLHLNLYICIYLDSSRNWSDKRTIWN